MKTFRVARVDRVHWVLQSKKSRGQPDWDTVSFHDSRKAAKAAEDDAFQREIETINARITVTHTRTTTTEP